MSDQQAVPQEMSDEDAIMKIAQAMKDNSPSEEEKHNVHSFLHNVVQTEGIEKNKKLGNLKNDTELDELGIPSWTVRGAAEMAAISGKLMDNPFYEEFFQASMQDTLATSLSRDGFVIRQGTTQTKQVADITRRRKVNKGWFGKKDIEESGGDSFASK